MRRQDITRLVIDIPSDRRKPGSIEVLLDDSWQPIRLPFAMSSNGGLVLEALLALITTQITLNEQREGLH
jgi:hypothetical protein